MKNLKGAQVNNRNAQKWNKFKAIRLGLNMLKWMQAKDENLFIEEFLLKYGHYKELTSYLSGIYPAFELIMDRAKQVQEHKLCKLALYNKINTAVAIFLLKNNFGYTDKQHLTHSAPGLNITVSNESTRNKLDQL